MHATDLQTYLTSIIESANQSAVMIWGKPGIGKSSIVESVANKNGLSLIDLRLSQLMPSDLRGLPVPEKGITNWAQPNFLPRDGQGVLFLDELNMAPPSLQGVAQQLILDRKVGDYELPDQWFVWAAGNRLEDRAAVHDMPSPLANRFLHVELQESIEDFRRYAYRQDFESTILAFLSFRPNYLHKPTLGEMAWPSPRSWQMANYLVKNKMPIDSAVGSIAASEYETYCRLLDDLPNIDAIVENKNPPKFPDDPSIAWAVITALVVRANTDKRALNSVRWLIDANKPEWTQLFLVDSIPLLQLIDSWDGFMRLAVKDKKVIDYLNDFQILSQ